MTHTLPFRLCLVLVSAAALAACATTEQPDLKPPSYLDAERDKISSQPQAIAGDACVVRDVSGSSDFILRKQTLDISQAALSSLESRLGAVGASLANTRLATACAGLERVGIPPRVAQTWEREAETLDQPVFTTSGAISQNDAALNRRLVAGVDAAIEGAEGGYKRRPLDLASDDLAALRDRSGTNALWVLNIVGIDVSATKGFLTGGSQDADDCRDVNLTQRERIRCEQLAEDSLKFADRFSYSLALVDLGSGEMVWFNNTRNVPGPPYEPSNYGAVWAKRALSPFYE